MSQESKTTEQKVEEPKLEKVQAIAPTPQELMVYADAGWQLYAIKDEVYYFNRWVIN